MPGVLIQGQPVTVVHRTVAGQDSRGNDIFTTSTFVVNYCSVHPGLSTENVQGTEEVTSDVTVMFPDGTNIGANDAMILQNGKQYEVQGDPNQWVSPFTGIRSFVEVQGRLVEGGSA